MIYLRQDDDLIPDATMIPDEEDALFPWTNAQSEDIAKPGKTPVGQYELNLLIDLGVGGFPWDMVVLINHNLSSTASIAVDSAATLATDTTGTMDWRERHAYTRIGSSRTHRYLRIIISDFGNPYGFISIGRIMCGLSTRLQFGFRYGWRNTTQQNVGMNRSPLGAKFRNYLSKLQELELTYEPLRTVQDRNQLTTFLDSLHGCMFWFFLVPHPDEYNGWPMCLMTNVNLIRDVYASVSGLVFEEEAPGILLGA